MTAPKLRRYWDAVTCLGWLADEPDKVDRCRTVLEAAERGEVEIVVSALTLAEVLHLKGSSQLPERDRQKIRDFFKREYILVVNVDRRVAELAQDVVWKHGVRPKDAVHVASALVARAEKLETFDDGLIALSGKVGDNPMLEIGQPGMDTQEDLFRAE